MKNQVRIFQPQKAEVRGGWERYIIKSFINFVLHQILGGEPG
jgi:hypothetical protein